VTPERFVDVAVVARRLGVSKVCVRNWIHDGKITAICQANGRFKIPLWELVARLERKRKPPTQISATVY
jgi:predicted site-specific integrase-resolvase